MTETKMPAEPPAMLLARKLYETMTRLDPGGPEDDPPWEELSAHQRALYRHFVRAILEERELVARVLADDDDV